jgi:mannose-6-phosphate isomerase-like protein (cupin superfamily)
MAFRAARFLLQSRQPVEVIQGMPGKAMAEGSERRSEAPYQVRKTTIVAMSPELRVSELALADGEEVPWHFHHHVDDVFYCLSGGIKVALRAPEEEISLEPGQSCRVPSGRVHRAVNSKPGLSRYLLVQGPGAYDFVPAE